MGTAVEERGGTRFYGVGYGMGRVCTVWHDAVPSGHGQGTRRHAGWTWATHVASVCRRILAFLEHKRRKNNF